MIRPSNRTPIIPFLPCLWLVLTAAQCPGSEISTFHGEDLAIRNQPYRLSIPPGDHVVSWGDGSVETVKGGEATHIYRDPGVAEITVRNKQADLPVMLDYGRMVRSSKPLVFLSEPREAGGGRPAAHLPAAVALARGGTFSVKTDTEIHADSFSVEAWVRFDAESGKQMLFSSNGDQPGAGRVSLDGPSLVFELIGTGEFRSNISHHMSDGAWHHLAVTYDRVPLFPWDNQVRFFINGAPAGNGTIDVADAGAVTCHQFVLGGGFKGAIAGLAVYDDLLFPLAILDRAKSVESGGSLLVTVAEPGSAPVAVDEPVIVRTVDVPMDPSPQADNGPALRKAVSEAAPGTRLRLVNAATGKPRGSYPIKSLLKAPRWAAVAIEDKTDFELDGGGATLVFSDSVARYFLIERCKRVALRNISVDLDPEYARVGMYAKIISTDPSTGNVSACVINGRDGKPVATLPSRASYWRWRAHDKRTLRIGGDGPFFDADSYAERPAADPAAGPGMIRFRLKQKPDHEFWKKLAAYQNDGGLYLINNADFSSNAVSLGSSSHVTFEYVRYHAVLGMVFLSSHIDHLRVVRCKISLPPGMTAADRPLTAGSDGYHFHLTRGSILFEQNEISLTDDDPVSIKDSMWTKLKRIDDRRLEISGGGIRKGEPVELLAPDFKPSGFSAKVTAVEGNVLVLDRNLPAEVPPGSVLMNREHHTRDWILRDNHLHDYYGRVMLYTGHGTVIGNRVHKSYYHLGISDADFERAGVSANVITHRNLFESTSADSSKWGGDPTKPGFHNITYSANSFLGHGLGLGSAEKPVVVRNWFAVDLKPGPPVKLSHSPNARVSHNVDAATRSGTFEITSKQSPGLISDFNRTATTGGNFKQDISKP